MFLPSWLASDPRERFHCLCYLLLDLFHRVRVKGFNTLSLLLQLPFLLPFLFCDFGAEFCFATCAMFMWIWLRAICYHFRGLINNDEEFMSDGKVFWISEVRGGSHDGFVWEPFLELRIAGAVYEVWHQLD
ncbi:hypothetical protein E2542_SST12003 [Spatholobus suberectus]|nr:hypothetical protein E2542_SST12003 [Spatholobus suberectus]